MKLFLLGATGNAGRRILNFGLERGHQVTAFVRDREKLLELLGRRMPQGLHVIDGDIGRPTELAAAMMGQDVVINAAGHVTEGERFTHLVQNVIDQTTNSLGAAGRLWQFGGAAALDIPGMDIMAVDLPMVPKVYEAHRTNLDALRKSSLDWSMLCPGPMIDAPNGKPTEGLRLSVDDWPVERPGFTYFLPTVALALSFKRRVPELTISYEDAAGVILNNLDRNGRFARRRVGVALPVGLRNFKADVPGR